MTTEIVLKALDEHATATEEFRAEVKSTISDMQTQLNKMTYAGDAATTERVLKSLGAEPLGAGGHMKDQGSDHRSQATGMVAEFSKSDQFVALANGAHSTGRVAMEGVQIKALTNVGQGVGGSTGFDVQPQRAAGIYNDPRRTLTILDLLPSMPVTASSFEYMSLKNYVNTAAFQVLEGQQKAESNFEMEPLTANIATVAHWTKASVQVLDDAPALGQKLMSLLEYGVLAKLESEIVGGTGGQGRIKGLLELGVDHIPSGEVDPEAMSATDRLGSAVVNLRANGWTPGAIILNPVDWYLISSQKGTDGQYVLGSPRDPSPPSLWGVPVVLTPSLARNVAIVLDPAQVAILDRQTPTLMVSREDGTNFTTNMVTILGELRAGLAVFAAGAVLIVDVTPAGLLNGGVTP